MPSLREAIESITTEEEKEHLRSLQVFAAHRYLSLVTNGQRPHGRGKRVDPRRKARRKDAHRARMARRG